MAIKNDVYSHVPGKRKPQPHLTMARDAATFRERLRYLMARYGVTAKELADAVYVCTPTINKYLIDCRTPGLEIAVSIADFFDVSLDWLAGRSGVARPNEEEHHGKE